MPHHYFLLFFCLTASDCLNHETSLYDHLFHNGYNRQLRPREDVMESVVVSLEFELSNVGDLSEVDQVLHTHGFIASEWEDDFLKWSPSDYGGIEHLVLAPHTVWLPDMGISNSADTFYHETFTRDFRVDLKYTGRVLWSFGGNFATSCTLDMTYYPFDIQKCDIKIDNWSYTKDSVDLVNRSNEVHLHDFSENGEWDLVNTDVATDVYEEDTHPGKLFPRVIFSLYLNRKPLYYFLNIVTPCLFCIVIAIMVFWLPPESGEKVSLGITVLLSFSVFQLVVADNTPKTSDFTPLLSVLMTAIMGMATVSVLTSILVLYMYHHSTARRAPKWLRSLAFKFLAKVFCMTSYVPGENSVLPQNITTSTDKVIDNPTATSVTDIISKSKLTTDDDLAKIRELVTVLVDTIKDKEKDSIIEEEWKALSMVLDRIFFWVTSITAVIMIPTFLIQKDPTPH